MRDDRRPCMLHGAQFGARMCGLDMGSEGTMMRERAQPCDHGKKADDDPGFAGGSSPTRT